MEKDGTKSEILESNGSCLKSTGKKIFHLVKKKNQKKCSENIKTSENYTGILYQLRRTNFIVNLLICLRFLGIYRIKKNLFSR